MAITSRVWELVTNLKDNENKDYITIPKLRAILEQHSIKNGGSIVNYAFILHDKDVYTAEKVLKEQPELKGQRKKDHVHVVMKFTYNQELDRLVEWFGLSANFFDKAKGRGAWEEKLQYLTHEDDKQQHLGKHLYDDSEIVADFDYRTTVDAYVNKKLAMLARYGKSNMTEKEALRMDIMLNGMTLKQAREFKPLLYAEDMEKLRKLRGDYLSFQKPSPIKINIYLDGPGGIGKNTMAIGIARAWFPNLDDDECFFEVNGKGVSFEGYDGQPILIWNDRRAVSFLTDFGREETFDSLFNPNPTSAKRQNIKYSSVALVNQINIINGIEPYADFLNGLAGEYKDRNGEQHSSEDLTQSYRRFPVIIPLRINDFDILLNKGYMTDNRACFLEYYLYNRVRGNIKKALEYTNSRPELQKQITRKLCLPIVETGKKIINDFMNKGLDMTDEEIIQMLRAEGFGTVKTLEEIEKEKTIIKDGNYLFET